MIHVHISIYNLPRSLLLLSSHGIFYDSVSNNLMLCFTLKIFSIYSRYKVGKGFFVRRDILEHRWNGLCLPEVSIIH